MRHLQITTMILGFLLISCKNQDQAAMLEAYCRPTLEYQTTLDYLRTSSLIKSSEQEARQIAAKVASGCQGAAERFINLVEVLSPAKLPSHTIVNQAIEIANTTSAKAESFVTVFRYSYLPSRLDLDTLSALQLARSLSIDFKGDTKRAEVDFSRLVDFCLQTLKLAKPACSEFAANVARYGEKLAEAPADAREKSWLSILIAVFTEDEGLVSKPYFEFFDFLTKDEQGPKLNTADAHRVAMDNLSHNPLAGKEFEAAFRYAMEKDGLNMDRLEATKFAGELSKKTADLNLDAVEAKKAEKL